MADQAVALSSDASLYLARSSELEAFLDARLGLQLRHFALQVPFDEAPPFFLRTAARAALACLWPGGSTKRRDVADITPNGKEKLRARQSARGLNEVQKAKAGKDRGRDSDERDQIQKWRPPLQLRALVVHIEQWRAGLKPRVGVNIKKSAHRRVPLRIVWPLHVQAGRQRSADERPLNVFLRMGSASPH